MIGSEEKAVKARKGVILTLGGFEFNEDLKNEYLKCYPFKFEGWQYNTGDGIKMVEDVGAKLWHMDMAISMYSMWTRDPENDFSILYFMPGFSYFNVNRLGKRYVNENSMGSPHNGWHTLLHSMTPSTTSTASRRGASSTRPASTPASCPPARAISSSAATSRPTCRMPSAHGTAGARTTRPSSTRAGSRGDTLDELARRSDFDHWMDPETLKATFDEYQAFCEAQKDARFDRSEKTLVALDEGPYYAISIYPGSCSSSLGGPMKNEPVGAPGARPGSETPSRACTRRAASATSRATATASPAATTPRTRWGSEPIPRHAAASAGLGREDHREPSMIGPGAVSPQGIG